MLRPDVEGVLDTLQILETYSRLLTWHAMILQDIIEYNHLYILSNADFAF